MSRVSAKQRLEMGAKRCRYRWRLREVMEANDVPSFVALGALLGVSNVAVSRTVSGEIHSPVVLDWFRKHGVPENQLCDPSRAAQ